MLLRSWRDQPDLVRVMVREVARSPQLQEQVDEIRAVFLVIQRVIERGQADGSFRPELDARLASWIFYGGLEELLTGGCSASSPTATRRWRVPSRRWSTSSAAGSHEPAPQHPSEPRSARLDAAERQSGPVQPESPEPII